MVMMMAVMVLVRHVTQDNGLTDDRGVSCRTAGEVLFADVLLLPNGMSKVGANA
jgi:hypothetical protein